MSAAAMIAAHAILSDRICKHGPHRSHDGCGGAHIAVDEERERDNADRENQKREEKTKPEADEGQSAAFSGFKDLMNETAQGRRRSVAEKGAIDCFSRPDPGEKDHHQECAKRQDGAARIASSRLNTLHQDGSRPCSSAADLIKSQPRKRPEEGKTRREGEEEPQHIVAEGQPRDEKANNRVNNAEKQHIARFSCEILPAFRQCIIQIGEGYFAHRRQGWRSIYYEAQIDAS